MKVLVEEKDSTLDLWFARYEGAVVAETADRYKVRRWGLVYSWVPKQGAAMRCVEIKQQP